MHCARAYRTLYIDSVQHSFFLVLVNYVEGMRLFKDRYFPQRDRYKDNLEGVHVTILQKCVSVETITGGLWRISLE